MARTRVRDAGGGGEERLGVEGFRKRRRRDDQFPGARLQRVDVEPDGRCRCATDGTDPVAAPRPARSVRFERTPFGFEPESVRRDVVAATPRDASRWRERERGSLFAFQPDRCPRVERDRVAARVSRAFARQDRTLRARNVASGTKCHEPRSHVHAVTVHGVLAPGFRTHGAAERVPRGNSGAPAGEAARLERGDHLRRERHRPPRVVRVRHRGQAEHRDRHRAFVVHQKLTQRAAVRLQRILNRRHRRLRVPKKRFFAARRFRGEFRVRSVVRRSVGVRAIAKARRNLRQTRVQKHHRAPPNLAAPRDVVQSRHTGRPPVGSDARARRARVRLRLAAFHFVSPEPRGRGHVPLQRLHERVRGIHHSGLPNIRSGSGYCVVSCVAKQTQHVPKHRVAVRGGSRRRNRRRDGRSVEAVGQPRDAKRFRVRRSIRPVRLAIGPRATMRATGPRARTGAHSRPRSSRPEGAEKRERRVPRVSRLSRLRRAREKLFPFPRGREPKRADAYAFFRFRFFVRKIRVVF